MPTLTYEAGFDIAQLGTFTMTVNEDAAGAQAITFTTGTYFHQADGATATGPHPSEVTGYTDFATALQNGWDGVSIASSVSVTFDRTTGHYTLAATGLSTLDITFNAVAQNLLGFGASVTGALSYESSVDAYYFIDAALGCRHQDSRPYEGGDALQTDTYAHDGSPSSLAKDAAPIYWDWIVPNEPRAIIWKIEAAAATPWTWEHFFPHVRVGGQPIAVYDGTDTWFHRLREEGATFKPNLRTKDYYGIADIPLSTQYLGKL